MDKQMPSIGRVVHFVLGPNANNVLAGQGEHRPGLIVRVWNPNCVNLIVFLDGSNDTDRVDEQHTMWVTSVVNDDTGKPGTWHWPEFVAPVKGTA